MDVLNSVFTPRDNTAGSVPVSGGGLSENNKFSYGYSSLRGKRASMEDFHETKISKVDGLMVGLFGVFDGHGGSRAAEFVQQHLFDNLLRHPKFFTDTKVAIAETYKQADQEYLKAENSQHRDAGSTASTAVLVGERLIVANVGDSRAVICRAGKAFPLSTDHKPNLPDERQRIEDAGGVVMWAGTWRVGGVLAVSRAFGDRLLKRYVVAEPEILCGLEQLSLEHKRELDSLLAAQPAPARAGYELLPTIQIQRYCNLEDVENLMTSMDEVFPCGLQKLRKSGRPYEIVLRLIADIEEAPAPPDGTNSAYLDLTDSRCHRQLLLKLLQVLRESEGSGDYGNAKLFVPFLQLLATDLLNI